MKEFLYSENIGRYKKTEYIKTEHCKRKRNKWKSCHRTLEQNKWKTYLKKRRLCHTYGVKADAIDIEQDGEEESKRAVGIVIDDLNVDKDSANNGSESGDSIDNGSSDSGDSIINDWSHHS